MPVVLREGGAWSRARCAVLACLLIGVSVLLWSARGNAEALPPGVSFGPTPAWVLPLDASNVREPDALGGAAVLVADFQTRIAGGRRVAFARRRMRVTTELGARSVGEQKYAFVPPYEALVIHALEVWRDGRRVSTLAPSAVHVMRREAKAEEGIYDGAQTAVAILGDVRVGDEIVSETSTTGANPVFEGHAMLGVELAFQAGVGRLRQRVVSDHELRVRMFGGAPDPELIQERGGFEYRWRADAVPALPREEGTPIEADAAPWAQLTDFQEWRDVVRWGRALFEPPARLPPELLEWQSELLRETDPERRVLRALRLVQERVRYLSLLFSASSHRPARPERVVERGFGDCKDKSLLAVALLRSVGVEAEVALVSSSAGQVLPRLLPTIQSFDHALVSVEIDGIRHWIDPTRLYQRGRLADVAVRGIRYALRLAEGVNEVATVPEPDEVRPDVRVLQRYAVKSFGGPVRLDVTTHFTGPSAELVRSFVAARPRGELYDALGSTVLKIHARALRQGEPRIQDQEAHNEIVVDQTFALDADDWTKLADGRSAFALFPFWLSGQLPTIPPERKTAVAVSYPLVIEHQLEIESPVALTDARDSWEIEHSTFALGFDSRTRGKQSSVHYGYSTRARKIEPTEFERFRIAQADVVRRLDFVFTAPVTFVAASRKLLFAVVFVWLVALLALIWFVHLREPYLRRPLVPYEPRLAGRRSWLALLGFGVCITPFRILIELWPTLNAYSATSWANLTSPGSPAYAAAWEPVLTVSLLTSIGQLVGSCYGVYLYWTARRSFPLLYLVLIGIGIVSGVFDAFIGQAFDLVKASPATPVVLVFKILVGGLWGGYLLQSRRVKATFLPDPGKSRDVLDARRAQRRRNRARDAAVEALGADRAE